MPRESRRDKALRYIAEERVEVTSANAYGIRLTVRGSRKEPYEVAYGRDTQGRSVTTCTCEGGEFHPIKARCSHIEVAKLLFRI